MAPEARGPLIAGASDLVSRFPRGFLWGAATSAYQVEGASRAGAKGESIWDVFCRRPEAIECGDNGDVACDHYHRWRQDVDLIRALGLNAYRFSVSWPRIMPDGTGAVNASGMDFYDRLVDALLENNVRPLVTLYHWDLPQALQDRGGWASAESPEWFAAYADQVARRLGDRVRDWATINEPEVVAFAGHARGLHAPGLHDWGVAVRVAHSLLLGHGLAASAARAAAPGARIGIVLNLSPCHPASESEFDVAAARRADGYLNRWFLDPLFGRGYPADMVEVYGEMLDSGMAAELDEWNGALDFLGVNYYTRRVVRASDTALLGFSDVIDPNATRTEMGWEVHPAGLGEVLARIHSDYSPAIVMVTENGAAYEDEVMGSGEVNDEQRRDYIAAHLGAAAGAIAQGVPLAGYFVWSLMDNFEWAHGYSKRFGVYRVDYETQKRTLKSSGRWYQSLIRAHSGVSGARS